MTATTRDQIATAVQSWFDNSISAAPIINNTGIWNQLYGTYDSFVDAIFAQVSGDSEAAAIGTLTFTPGTVADDKIVIGGVYYQFCTTVSGSADGTSTTPWQVAKGANATASLTNLKNAINGGGGVAGTDYSAGIIAHPSAKATASTSTTLSAAAIDPGVAGNSITTTVVVVTTSDGFAWGSGTLTGGSGTDWDAVEGAIDDWRDSVRAVPLEADEDSITQLQAAMPVLKTAIAALLP